MRGLGGDRDPTRVPCGEAPRLGFDWTTIPRRAAARIPWRAAARKFFHVRWKKARATTSRRVAESHLMRAFARRGVDCGVD
jgi:hypothetical protein